MHRVLHGFIAFLGELRRRRVYQAAAAYIPAAWLIIEVASVIAPEFEFLPDGTVRFIIVLVCGVSGDHRPRLGLRRVGPGSGRRGLA